MLSADDARLVSFLHGGFPLSDRPFAAVGAQLGCSEEAVIERLQRLLRHGELTRFGPLFQIERAGGRFVLAAMAVPEVRFAAVAAQLDGLVEVAHNYKRESALAQRPGHAPRRSICGSCWRWSRQSKWPPCFGASKRSRDSPCTTSRRKRSFSSNCGCRCGAAS